MPRKVRSLRCPTCRKIVLLAEPEFPFCSARCRLIDLGKWASGGYVISSPIHEADQFGDADYTIPNSPAAQRRKAPSTDRPDGKDSKH
jgi:endogenous inhibitor of DNA gyrase (YacG/DUF329 family)